MSELSNNVIKVKCDCCGIEFPKSESRKCHMCGVLNLCRVCIGVEDHDCGNASSVMGRQSSKFNTKFKKFSDGVVKSSKPRSRFVESYA